MITQKSIDAIFAATRIEEVIDDFVRLRKRGVNMIGLCPFHDEKTPSFTVSPARNIFKCFGCGRGGNAVSFLMEHEGHSYPEALRYLAKQFKIPIEETAESETFQAEKLVRESLLIVNEYTRDFYVKQLHETDLGKSIGLSYFKERGLRLHTIEKFELGFAPNDRDALTSQAVGQGYNIEHLRQLGLTTSSDRDFFFNRVIFPIHNISGKVVAFAGRQLTSNKRGPKYMNSKESEVYNKSKILYGAYFAKQAIRKEDQCILVEGYTDVLALHQSDIHHVVASSGTSLTVDQIKLIKRYTPNINILFDGDPAGIKAALRGIDLILAQDMNVKLILLPENEDPDSYLKKVGVKEFKAYLEDHAADFILFKANLILEEAADDPVKKAGLIKNIIESLAHIPDQIKRSVYIQKCASLLEVEERILIAETNKFISQRIRDQRIDRLREANQDHKEQQKQEEYAQKIDPTISPLAEKVISDEYQERDILRILILFGDTIFETEPKEISVAEFIISNIQDTLEAFDNPFYAQIIIEIGNRLNEGKKSPVEFFLHHSEPEIAKFAVDICASPYDYSENWENRWDIRLQTQPKPEENVRQDSLQALYRFMLRKFRKMTDENMSKIKEMEKAGKDSDLLKHLQVQQLLIEKRNEIAGKLNTVIIE